MKRFMSGRYLTEVHVMLDWIKCKDRLPVIGADMWRTDKAYPVLTVSVGLTYAYSCVTNDGHRYWEESHIMGDGKSEMCATLENGRRDMIDVISWIDIKEFLTHN